MKGLSHVLRHELYGLSPVGGAAGEGDDAGLVVMDNLHVVGQEGQRDGCGIGGHLFGADLGVLSVHKDVGNGALAFVELDVEGVSVDGILEILHLGQWV